MSTYQSTVDEQWLSDISSGLGIVSGAREGGTAGDTRAGLSAAKLGANTGVFGSASSEIGTAAADLSNIAGIYSGVRAGGVVGYTGAGANAAALGARTGAFGSASGAVGAAAGWAAAGISIYEFARNWRSGSTGADAASGAETGASVGTAIEPGIGTIVGAVIGGAAGAVSSLFGPGRQDPENTGWDQYAGAFKDHGAAGVAGALPQDNFQMLAGIFDARGSQIPFYGKYGRMGENAFMGDMTGVINKALAAGKISKTDTPATIYSKVVQPWISSMSPNGWQDTNTIQGAPEKAAIGNLLTSMIGQYQKGQQGSWTGIAGQASPVSQPFGALGAGPHSSAQVQTHVAKALAPVHSAVLTMPGVSSTSSGSSAMLPLLLAMPGLAAGLLAGGAMANPTSPQTPYDTGAPPAVQAGSDPSGAGGGSSSADPNWLSSLSSSVSSFLSSPAGTLAEFGTLAGLGLAQANSQKNTNDALASSLAKPGQPYAAAGAAELSQATGGPSMGGPMGASVTQQTGAAANLGKVANEYSTGQATPAQEQQIQDFIKQQRAMVDTQLAASGNTDSSAKQAAYQQIDNNAMTMRQNLVAGNTQLAEGALTAVQQTYSTILNQALTSSEFGFSTQEAAVMTQIQSDTQLAGQLQALFAAIAQGYGTAMSGGKGGTATRTVLPGVGTGVAGSPSGGGGNVSNQYDPNANAPAPNQPVDPNSLSSPFDPSQIGSDVNYTPPPNYAGDPSVSYSFGDPNTGANPFDPSVVTYGG